MYIVVSISSNGLFIDKPLPVMITVYPKRASQLALGGLDQDTVQLLLPELYSEGQETLQERSSTSE